MRVTAVFWLVLGHLSVCQGGWTCSKGHQLTRRRAAQVDAGLGQLVATDTYRSAYFLSSYYWKTLYSSNLKHVSVGQAGIWGIDAKDKIYKHVDGIWKEVPGRLKQIDAGGDGFVVGVNSADRIYCLPRSSTLGFNGQGAVPWVELGGRLKYFSCGPYGCWGVNSADHIFFNALRSADCCSFSGWQHIGGSLRMIEVGTDGKAFGVNRNNHVFERTGITAARPLGTGWRHISCLGTMKQVSYDLGTIYGASTTGVIMKATE